MVASNEDDRHMSPDVRRQPIDTRQNALIQNVTSDNAYVRVRNLKRLF